MLGAFERGHERRVATLQQRFRTLAARIKDHSYGMETVFRGLVTASQEQTSLRERPEVLSAVIDAVARSSWPRPPPEPVSMPWPELPVQPAAASGGSAHTEPAVWQRPPPPLSVGSHVYTVSLATTTTFRQEKEKLLTVPTGATSKEEKEMDEQDRVAYDTEELDVPYNVYAAKATPHQGILVYLTGSRSDVPWFKKKGRKKRDS